MRFTTVYRVPNGTALTPLHCLCGTDTSPTARREPVSWSFSISGDFYARFRQKIKPFLITRKYACTALAYLGVSYHVSVNSTAVLGRNVSPSKTMIMFTVEAGAIGEMVQHDVDTLICVNAGIVTCDSASAMVNNATGIKINRIQRWDAMGDSYSPRHTTTYMQDLSDYFDHAGSQPYRVLVQSRHVHSADFLAIQCACLGIPIKTV